MEIVALVRWQTVWILHVSYENEEEGRDPEFKDLNT